MLQGQYQVEQIDGPMASVIKAAVAAFQGKHGGRLPQYVWCPEDQVPDEDEVQSWAVRGVVVSSHKDAKGGVFAGPVEAEVVACPG